MKKKIKEEKTIKAYQIVEETDRLPFIHSLKKKIALTELNNQSRFLSSFVFENNQTIDYI